MFRGRAVCFRLVDFSRIRAMTTPSSTTGMTASEALKELERFVVENDDLLMLESRIGRFNIFDALGLARVEIRHSNFLAFILDPAESHGQGQLFLKAILMDLLKRAPVDLRPLSPIDLDGTDLRGVEVKREWKNIDLLITSKAPQFAVVIENKVDSQEHSNQLGRYQQSMNQHYLGLPSLYVFLTPDGDDPSEASWVPYTYDDIHRVLKRTRDSCQNAIGDDVLVFLDHYLNLLGTRFMNDEKIDELCRRIYKNHRQALDLIWERVGSPESAIIADVENALNQDGRWHVCYRSSKYIEFVPTTWLAWLPTIGSEDNPSYSVLVHVRSKETKLQHILYVGPMNNAAKREEIIKKLREACQACGLKRSQASEIAENWARVTAANPFLEWGEGEEPDDGTIHAKVKTMLDGLYPKLEKLALVLKPLCDFQGSAN